jgi:DNA-binding MarR family transcriptional regulator/GNAT superfamily N-acetyltransferase
MTLVDEIRGFNRFYTQKIGLLAEHLPESDLSLPEARILYELAQREEQTAADLTRELNMDKAHVSRIVGRFRARGLLESRISPTHGRHVLLSLTQAGRAMFVTIDAGSRAAMDRVLSPLGQDARARLGGAMDAIRRSLSTEATPAETFRLRAPACGDLGWIMHRQMVLYHQEYDWDWTFEGLVGGILGQFVANYDAEREQVWVAERHGSIVGSVFLVKSDDPTVAKLRLLYVEPAARGLGIGRALVDACIERARALGYRTLTLWTNDILIAARRIYQAAGFELVDEAPHHSFGHDLMGQNWNLDLSRAAQR